MSPMHEDDDDFERALFAARLPVLESMPLDLEDVHHRVEIQRGRLAAVEALGRSRPLRVAWAVAAAALFATYLGAMSRASVVARATQVDERVATNAADPAAMICRDDCIRQPCMSVAASIDWTLAAVGDRARADGDGAAAVCVRALVEPTNASLASVTFTPARP